MKTILTFFTFCILLSSNVFAQESTETVWKTYNTENYEIKYPETWDFRSSESSRMDFLAQCPLESDDDMMRENVNLVKESAQDLSLEDYFISTKTMLERTFPEIEIISTEDITRNDIAMKVIKYTAKFGPEHLYFSQIFAIHDNTAYALTFNSEKSKQEQYKVIEDVILASFNLIVK